MASDHHLVVGVVRVKLAAIKPKLTSKAPRRFLVDSLKQKEVKRNFVQSLIALTYETQHTAPRDLDDSWKLLKIAFISAGEAAVGYRRNSREEWISQESWNIIDERKSVKALLNTAQSLGERIDLGKKHAQLNKKVKRSVRRDKRAWINNLAALAQQAAESNNTKLLYHITKKLSGRRFANSPPLKAKDGALLTSKNDQLEL
ncbi:uncharacterized protein [Temnothorax longispinosus]|uniref:uncharacterized protein n=1 Tax=Temnothorax longispinosus TaxID=300112 RepID=UPI003A999078